MGGSWDATNVADATVAVVTADRRRPRAVPRRRRPAEIARREGRDHQARRDRGAAPSRTPDVAEVLAERCAEVGATRGCARASSSASATGCRPSAARCCRCRGCAARTTRSSCRSTAPTRRRTPRSRWPRSRRSSAERPARRRAGARGVRARSTSPGRLEVIRRSPTIVLDAAHNPHGAEAVVDGARGLVRLRPADRRRRGDGRQGLRGRCSAAFEPRLAARRLHPELHRPRDAGRRARRGGARDLRRRTACHVAPRLADAIDQAAALAEAGGVVRRGDRLRRACWSPARWSPSARPGRCCGAARVAEPSAPSRRDAPRGMCAAILSLEAIALGLTTPGADRGGRRRHRHRALDRARAVRRLPAWSPGCSGCAWAYALGWAIQVAAIAARVRGRR